MVQSADRTLQGTRLSISVPTRPPARFCSLSIKFSAADKTRKQTDEDDEEETQQA